MNCMKCGREVLSEQVFCEDCLATMGKHPVEPGTPVQIPRRQETAVVKKAPKRRTVPLEEQVRILKSRIRMLTIALIIACGLVLALVYPAVKYWMDDHFALGQNYSVTSSANTSTTTSQ